MDILRTISSRCVIRKGLEDSGATANQLASNAQTSPQGQTQFAKHSVFDH